ncbi:unnamed protein product [Symbiodinium necroappetens]|uniref:Uncharacterized protein n=1 Tax=Symbiodinium necroappetens TaxID=1628268 RepID=A0A812MXG6_9DINO|nr:unnamed protein product [Symbiodinium necroappetens]
MLICSHGGAFWILVCGFVFASTSCNAYDFQYFLPQEFLSDLPLREGSLALEVIQLIQSIQIPDAHHKKVEEGTFSETYADSDFNSAIYREQRKVCTQYRQEGTHMERPMCASEVGRFALQAQFEFDIPGHLEIKTRICFGFCWHESVCSNHHVKITGTVAVSSLVDVTNNAGKLKMSPHTQVSWLDGPTVHGCHPDLLVRLFEDVQPDLSDGVRSLVKNYVEQNLQSPLSFDQNISIHPGLNLTYTLRHLEFVYSDDPMNQSFVVAHAACTAYATARNGSVQAFPEANAPWTGRHSRLPLSDRWNRAMGEGQEQLVLLGGARFSQELLTMLARSLHYMGLLYSENSTHVKDAVLYSTIDFDCPQVDISQAQSGVLMRQRSLHFQAQCLDVTTAPASNFSLLNATFRDVVEQISIKAYVPNDHTAGITLHVLNATLSDANLTSFHSKAFMGQDSQLKALAQQAIQNSIPLINDHLDQTPITFCGGGSSACALVPFAPHPAVSTVPTAGASHPGYVEVSWHCQCGHPAVYDPCLGFPCPEVRANDLKHPLARQLRKGREEPAPMVLQPRPRSQQEPNGSSQSTAVWVSMFGNSECRFLPDEVMSFGRVGEGDCIQSSESALTPAFQLLRDTSGGSGWQLSRGCTADCSACSLINSMPLRRCTCIRSDTCLLVSSLEDECVGGLKPYPDHELVFTAQRSTLSRFVEARRLRDCVPCGVFEDLSCAANRDQGNQSASLLCRGCPAPATACVFPNVSWGEHLVPKSPLGVKSGYSKVVLATPSLLPVLRACPAPDDRGAVSGTLVVAVLLVLGIMMAAGVLARKRLGRGCRWNCRLRLWVRLCRKDSFYQERRFHLCLLVGAVLLSVCGLVWMCCNPLVGQLSQMVATMDVSGFDLEGASRIVEASHVRGTWILFGFAAVLAAISALRILWLHVLVRVGTSPPSEPQDIPDQLTEHWRSLVIFLLAEGGAAVSYLAFVFWQRDFSALYERQQHRVGDLGILSGATASSASAVFCMKLLLSWLAPLLINSRLSTGTVIWATFWCRAASCHRAHGGRGLETTVLGILLTQETTALIWTIAYFHSGYASAMLLWLGMFSTFLNGFLFCLLAFVAPHWRPWPLAMALGCVATLQLLVNGKMAWLVVDESSLAFLLTSGMATLYFSYSAVMLLSESKASVSTGRPLLEADQPVALGSSRVELVSVLALLWHWLLEKEEASAPSFGARIKWRRLCLFLGSFGLMVDLQRTLRHNSEFSAWDDMNALIASLLSSRHAVLDPDPDSGLKFLALALSRSIGFIGSLAYASGLLVFNLPDYVGLLDFGELQRCGSGFCSAVAFSMKTAIGSGLLAKAAVEFLPLLVSFSWTLFRIGFFLALDSRNADAVKALMWVTLSCMLRLSPLPGTAAFIASPGQEVILWFSAFLLMPAMLLAVIVKFRLTHLGWYFLWGWVLYLVPLLMMARYALGMDLATLLHRLYKYLKADWPSFLAEFTLSDVVLSDLFFAVLFSKPS